MITPRNHKLEHNVKGWSTQNKDSNLGTEPISGQNTRSRTNIHAAYHQTVYEIYAELTECTHVP